MITFNNLDALWLMLLLPFALGMSVIIELRVRRIRRTLAAFPLLAALQTRPSYRTGRVALRMAILTALIISLARPVRMAPRNTPISMSISVMIAIDISRSMLAEDVSPNRLDHARGIANAVIDSLRDQGRIGLVVFSGSAYVFLPLTEDINTARLFLNRLSTDTISQQGSNLYSGLQTALRNNSDAVDTVIVLSDGEYFGQDPLIAASHAAAMSIPVYTVGIGTADGAIIPIDGTPLRDGSGNIVTSRLHEPPLQQLAETTGGIYQRVDAVDFQVLFAHLRQMVVQSVEDTRDPQNPLTASVSHDEITSVCILIALIMLVVEKCLAG